jgi:hypothetical protein
MWWNLLSLDAPTVAILWAALFAHNSGFRVTFAEQAALGISVWIIYVCDRILDSWLAADVSALQPRHQFCYRHSRSFAATLLIAMICLAWIVSHQLPKQEAWDGIKIAGIVAAYLMFVQLKAGRLACFVPKEVFVGMVFALGTNLSAWSQARHCSWILSVQGGFFAVLCVLNCASIEYWEAQLVRCSWPSTSNLLLRWTGAHLNSLYLAASGSALLAAMFFYTPYRIPSALLAVTGGALSLLLINCMRANLSRDALRVLADAALVLPAILALAVQT